MCVAYSSLAIQCLFQGIPPVRDSRVSIPTALDYQSLKAGGALVNLSRHLTDCPALTLVGFAASLAEMLAVAGLERF